MFGIYYMQSSKFWHIKKRRLSRASLFLYYIPFFCVATLRFGMAASFT